MMNLLKSYKEKWSELSNKKLMNNLTTQQIFWDLINFSTEEQSAGVGSTEKPGVGS